MQITDTVELFDVKETCRFFGGSRPINPATLYRGIKVGLYPAPVKLGPGISRWLKGECVAAIAKLAAARNGGSDERAA